ncbi:MAG: bifunctional methionine sulfoxide reductase B/A protein [Sedimentisphaerales bacterium]|nr:bifunctional methionine sulfoxide reductase B/A protein [Sedimentisphaerales bacterium]
MIKKVLFYITVLMIILGGVYSSIPRSTATQPQTPQTIPSQILIDDFTSPKDSEQFPGPWEFITDQVMGGVSTGNMETGKWDERDGLRMRGNVSLENNGGFIQMRLMLKAKGENFDASGYDGIRLKVKGNDHTYAVHLRTRHTWMPWQYYQADFLAGQQWQQINIPFKKFKSYNLEKDLDVTSLESIAIVASEKAFTADVTVDEISFYKDMNEENYKKLTPEEARVIVHKGTERPFTGKYYKHKEQGTYTCKRCGADLFTSSSKFESGCGWPSFDDQIPGAVKSVPDADGIRTEILCNHCGAHLGHVFVGEALTPKNTRYCVNSISMDFKPADEKANKTQKAVFAGGCFWGVEYHFKKVPGVLSTSVGYTGGHVDKPSYKQVCSSQTGHAEAMEVVFDPAQTSFEDLAKLFFEIHDFTQMNRQGPDIGPQYRSAIFYQDEHQKEIAEKLIKILTQKGYDVKTQLVPAQTFWPAEDYHQDYYQKKGSQPYCHIYKKIF